MTATRMLLAAALLLPSFAAAGSFRVGVTTKADVRSALGDPMEFTTDVLDGDVELVLAPGSPVTVDAAIARARMDPDKRAIAEYEVLQYWASDRGTETISFVFRPGEDRLLYAIVKPSPSEDTYDEAVKRYGRKPALYKRVLRDGHLWLTTVHMSFASEGVELVIDNPDLVVTKKLLVYRDAKGRAFIPKGN